MWTTSDLNPMISVVGFSIKVPSGLALLNSLKYLALDALKFLKEFTSHSNSFKIYYLVTVHSYTSVEVDVILQTIIVLLKIPTM